jgi:hypothetical protein
MTQRLTVSSNEVPLWRYQRSKSYNAILGRSLCLADPGLWVDEVHLKPAGARVFTQAFADNFIDAIKKQQR